MPTEVTIKAAVRKRDGHRCTVCGMTREQHFAKYNQDLDVHRVKPGSAYSLESGVCVTVCRRCHGPLPRSERGALLCRDLMEGRSIQRYFNRHPELWRRLCLLAERRGTSPNTEAIIALQEQVARDERTDPAMVNS